MPKKNFPPKVGDGRFEVQDKLGEGCFGAVFLGKDKKSDSPVAVKFEDSQCGAPGSLAMENSLLKQLGEPQRPQGFAEVFFFGKVGSFTCMVMDLLGKSLEECMEVCQGKMEPSSVVLIAEQALRRIEPGRPGLIDIASKTGTPCKTTSPASVTGTYTPKEWYIVI